MRSYLPYYLSVILFAASCCPADDVLSTLNDTDVEFAKLSSEDNNGMRSLTSLVLAKSTSSTVREVAAIIEGDCLEGNETLRIIALDLNLQPGDAVINKYQDLHNQLQIFNGRSFDSVYIHGLTMIHETRQKMFSVEMTNGINRRLKDYAGERSRIAYEVNMLVDSIAATY